MLINEYWWSKYPMYRPRNSSKPIDDSEIDRSQVSLVLSHYPEEYDLHSVKKVSHYKLLWADSLYNFNFEPVWRLKNLRDLIKIYWAQKTGNLKEEIKLKQEYIEPPKKPRYSDTVDVKTFDETTSLENIYISSSPTRKVATKDTPKEKEEKLKTRLQLFSFNTKRNACFSINFEDDVKLVKF